MPTPRHVTSGDVNTRPVTPTVAVPPQLPLDAPTPVAAPAVLLTAGEVADLLRVDVYTVRRYARTAELPGYRVGQQLRFDQADVVRFLHERRSS